jgi:hypothetical protein
VAGRIRSTEKSNDLIGIIGIYKFPNGKTYGGYVHEMIIINIYNSW